jgi:hypothetical protein
MYARIQAVVQAATLAGLNLMYSTSHRVRLYFSGLTIA